MTLLASLPTDWVCLGLGANLQPETALLRAIYHIRRQLPVLGVSGAWQTPAFGLQAPDFVNAALLVRSALPALQLKREILRPIEASLGRLRSLGECAATETVLIPMDIDLLIHPDQKITPSLWLRPYLALPVAELLPDLHQPNDSLTLAQAAQHWLHQPGILPRPDIRLKE